MEYGLVSTVPLTKVGPGQWQARGSAGKGPKERHWCWQVLCCLCRKPRLLRIPTQPGEPSGHYGVKGASPDEIIKSIIETGKCP